MSRLCFFLGEMAQLHSNRIVVRRVIIASISDMKRFGKYSTFDAKCILGMLLDVIQKKSLDTSLVQNDLLEPRESNRYIR